jgi:HK97 family phage portal protein
VNPFRSLFPSGKSYGAGSAVESLISAYLRDGGDSTAYNADQAMRIAAVASCERLISETVGSLPLHVFVRETTGGKHRVPPKNSLEKLLQKPNPWQTSMEFREQLTGHLLLRGNAYAYIEWATTRSETTGVAYLQAVNLFPLQPDQIEVVASSNYKEPPKYYLHRGTRPKLELPADEVLHIRGLSSDGTVGRSVLYDAQETFNGALTTQRYANRLFENDATPGVVLEHPQQLSKEARERIKQSWQAAHGGPMNARKTAVLEEGMKVSKLSVTPNEAQFLETRQFQRAEIAGLFRVPPHLIGDVDRSTSWGTGIEQQQIAFLVYTIRPWLIRWEQAIKRCLILREEEVFAEHLVEGLLRGDIASRYDAYVKAVNNGIYTPNEIRAFENANPMADPNADKLYRPANIVPIDTPADQPLNGRPAA